MATAVKVAVRVRPLNSRENKMDAKNIIEMDGKQTRLTNPSMTHDVKKFTFDYSYDSSVPSTDRKYVNQATVYKDLGVDIVTSCFEGYNACLFAYGQTGSGKSYSMMGYGEAGLIPRICQGIFEQSAKITEVNPECKFVAEVGYLEIYNEKVRDLLVKGQSHNLKVRENPKTGPFVDGLTSRVVENYDGINQLMDDGNANRTTAKTNMNDTSSRSHAVFSMKFTQVSFVEGIPLEKTSKINLVDLAGSERTSSTGATGVRLKEGGNINKSLTTLGLVIHALAERSQAKEGSKNKKKFVPYRDSTLTWLLRESLGGNSKTIMLAAVSPADVNYGETLSTLHYANRAKNIVNKAVVNEDDNVRLIKELRAEIDKLKDLLGGDDEIARITADRAAARARLDAATTDAEKEAAQNELATLDSQMANAEKNASTLAQTERMMSGLTDQWKDKWQHSTDLMESKSLGLSETGVAVRLESEKPHLVSLNLDDALSTGVTLYYVDEGETKLGKAGTTDKMGSAPQIELMGEEVLAEHCVITNQGDETVTLTPLAPPELVQVNGTPISEPCELQQGMMIVLGRDNIFRFNHPRQASRLRQARDSAASPDKLSREASGVFSLNQIFDKDKNKLADTEKRLLELQQLEEARIAENAKVASEVAEKNRQAEELAAKLAEMKAEMAAKDASLSNMADAAAADNQERESRLTTMNSEKEALEKEKQDADARAHAMEAEIAALAVQRKAQEELEATLVKEREEERKRLEEEAAATAAARAEEAEKARLNREDLEAQIANEKLQMAEQMKKQEESAEIAKKEAGERLLEAEQMRKEKENSERERKQAILEAEKMKKERQAEKEDIEAKQMRAEAEALKAKELADKKSASEADQRRKIKRLEAKMNHRDRVHSLQRSATLAFAKQDAGDFEAVWGVRVPRFHDRSDASNASGHMVFECRISCRGEEWKVFKRYSQFEQLHKLMKKTLPGVVATMKFPGKKWKPNAQFLAQRRLDLEIWLRTLIEMTHNHPASPFFQTSKRQLQKDLPFFNDGDYLQ